MQLTMPTAPLLIELPPPYRLVGHGSRPGADDAESWAVIIHAAGERLSIEAARAQYDKEFRGRELTLSERMLFLLDADGQPVGTATAWFQPAEEEGSDVGSVGRVHWVALVPRVQGRGLAKPLLGAVLHRLVEVHRHPSVRLKTHTQAARAVAMYLQAGFVPVPALSAGGYTEEEAGGWQRLAALGLPVEVEPGRSGSAGSKD